MIQSELMLKRKSGNLPDAKLIKKLKKSKSRYQENKYEQKTISQTLFLMPKPPEIPKFSLHPHIYGLISSCIKKYKGKIRSKLLSSDDPEKSLIVQGPAGCGKTHFVRQLASDFNLRLLELNASAHRSNVNIKRILGEASQTFSIDQGENVGTIIFIDDIDIILDPDKGFYKGIEAIIETTRCIVIMTCVVVPEVLLNHRFIKICKLNESKSLALEMVYKLRDLKITSFNNLQIENIYVKTKGNLHAIYNFLSGKVRVNQDFAQAYGCDVNVESAETVKVVGLGIVFDELKEQGLYLQTMQDMDEYMQNLVELDLVSKQTEMHEVEGTYRVSEYMQAIEKFYWQNRDPDEAISICTERPISNFKRVAREHLLHMGDCLDFIDYLQIIERFPVSLQPSYLLRQSKSSTSYLDIFLQKNPNQFYS